MERAQASKNFKDLQTVIGNAPELLNSNIQCILNEKKKFDEKMESKQFAYVTRRKAFYDQVIDQVDQNARNLQDLYEHGSKKADSIMNLKQDPIYLSQQMTDLANSVIQVDDQSLQASPSYIDRDRQYANQYSAQKQPSQYSFTPKNQFQSWQNANPTNPAPKTAPSNPPQKPTQLFNPAQKPCQIPPNPTPPPSLTPPAPATTSTPIPTPTPSTPQTPSTTQYPTHTYTTTFYKPRGTEVYRLTPTPLPTLQKPPIFKAENLTSYRLLSPTPSSLYILGGTNNDEYKHVYSKTRLINLATRTWTTLAPMLTPRCNFGATLSPCLNYIYVAGGDVSQEGVTGEAEVLDVDKGGWKSMGAMGVARSHVSLCVQGSRGEWVYAVGGFVKGKGEFVDVVERCQVGGGEWEMVGVRMPVGVAGVGLVSVGSGEVLVMGGWTGGYGKKVWKVKWEGEESVKEVGEMEEGDMFETNGMYGKRDDGKLIVLGKFAVHYLDLDTYKIESKKYN